MRSSFGDVFVQVLKESDDPHYGPSAKHREPEVVMSLAQAESSIRSPGESSNEKIALAASALRGQRKFSDA
jgi:hypothetical protein